MTDNGHQERQWLSARIDGELNVEEASRLDSHLPDCPACRLELEELRAAKRRLGSAPRRAMPPDLLADIETAAVPSRTRIWAGMLRREAGRRWAPAAASAGALALALWFGFIKHGKEELPIEALAAAHARYSAEGLIPGDLVAANFSDDLAQFNNAN